MSSHRLPVQSHALALLIDADNTSVDLFPQIMKKVEAWGKITMRRVYGNQETLMSQKWKDLCLQHALQPIPHVGISGAKNATDIALTVDAMDLLYKESIPSFCLVTAGTTVAESATGVSPICAAADLRLITLIEAHGEAQDVAAEILTQAFFTVMEARKACNEGHVETQPAKVPASKSHRDPALTQLLTQAVGKIMLEKKLEWVSLPRLGSCLKQLNPQFQAKTYGHKSLPELIKTCTDLFEIRLQGNHLEVRLKARNTG